MANYKDRWCDFNLLADAFFRPGDNRVILQPKVEGFRDGCLIPDETWRPVLIPPYLGGIDIPGRYTNTMIRDYFERIDYVLLVTGLNGSSSKDYYNFLQMSPVEMEHLFRKTDGLSKSHLKENEKRILAWQKANPEQANHPTVLWVLGMTRKYLAA
jgi:hypothetical protein